MSLTPLFFYRLSLCPPLRPYSFVVLSFLFLSFFLFIHQSYFILRFLPPIRRVFVPFRIQSFHFLPFIPELLISSLPCLSITFVLFSFLPLPLFPCLLPATLYLFLSLSLLIYPFFLSSAIQHLAFLVHRFARLFNDSLPTS